MDSAAEILKTARRDAGLSQAELARRAGVPQSSVSLYERSVHEPSVAMLAKLIEATGQVLKLVVVPRAGETASVSAGSIKEMFKRHREVVIQTLARYRLCNPRWLPVDSADGEDLVLIVDPDFGFASLDQPRCQRDIDQLVGIHVEMMLSDQIRPELISPGLASL